MLRLLSVPHVVTSTLLLTCMQNSLLPAQEPFRYEAQFDALVEPYLKHDKVAGISVGVISEGRTWTKNYGTLEPDGNVVPSGKTIYEIGSVSKVLTSLLLADAVVQGRIQLDDPIGKHWKELAEGNPDVAESVTYRHLSHHTSGLPVMPSNIVAEDSTNPFADYRRELLDDYMMLVRLPRRPGESYEYSNLAVGLLGDLLSRQAGMSYEELVRERITSH